MDIDIGSETEREGMKTKQDHGKTKDMKTRRSVFIQIRSDQIKSEQKKDNQQCNQYPIILHLSVADLVSCTCLSSVCLNPS